MNTPSKAFLSLAAALGALFVASAPAADGEPEPFNPGRVTVEYTEFASEVRSGDRTLPLRGGGMVEYWSFDVYTAALYVPEDKKAIAEILAPETPRALIICYHRSISSDDLIDATNQGLDKDPGLDREALAARVDRVNGSYLSVKAGDRAFIEWVPERGTTKIGLNGRKGVEIEGADFAAAYFGIWVGDHPLDKTLSAQLQGS